MKKTMFALTYCFEGVDDNCPYVWYGRVLERHLL